MTASTRIRSGGAWSRSQWGGAARGLLVFLPRAKFTSMDGSSGATVTNSSQQLGRCVSHAQARKPPATAVRLHLYCVPPVDARVVRDHQNAKVGKPAPKQMTTLNVTPARSRKQRGGKAASRPRQPGDFPTESLTHVLVHWESCLQGLEIHPCDRAGSCRLGQPGLRNLTSSWTASQNKHSAGVARSRTTITRLERRARPRPGQRRREYAVTASARHPAAQPRPGRRDAVAR